MRSLGILLGFMIVLSSTQFEAQQRMRLSQTIRSPYLLNPAATGIYDFFDATLVGRTQWMGFGDEPRSGVFGFSKVLGLKHRTMFNPSLRISQGVVRNPEVNTGALKHAIGGQVFTDTYGAFSRTHVSGVYAIHLPINDRCNMSFGTRVGLSNSTFNAQKAVVGNLNDPSSSYNGGDNTYDKFVTNQSNKFNLDIDAGLYVYAKRFFVGLSADNMTKNAVSFGSGTANFNYQLHTNIIGGLKLRLGENLTVTPSVIARYMKPSPVSVETNVLFDYKELVWFGGGYRIDDAAVAMVGMNLSNKFKLGYSYDVTTSRMNSVKTGTHELVLGIMLGR
jgi:type IX secretion system PorP/SprF family membrane protein